MAEKHRRRTKQYLLNLGEEEHAVLEARADEYGMSKNELLRNYILFGGAPQKHDYLGEENVKYFLAGLHEIGEQLNDVAHETNLVKDLSLENFNRLKELYGELWNLYSKWAIESDAEIMI